MPKASFVNHPTTLWASQENHVKGMQSTTLLRVWECCKALIERLD